MSRLSDSRALLNNALPILRAAAETARHTTFSPQDAADMDEVLCLIGDLTEAVGRVVFAYAGAISYARAIGRFPEPSLDMTADVAQALGHLSTRFTAIAGRPLNDARIRYAALFHRLRT